jgi:hypothetical protein
VRRWLIGGINVSAAARLTPDRGWKRALEDPIPLPCGRQFVTLRDAALYITKLPEAEHDAEPRQAAMEALLLVAEHGGPTMLDVGAGQIVKAMAAFARVTDSSRTSRHVRDIASRRHWTLDEP